MPRKLLVYGNCQAGWIAQRLAATPAVAAEFQVLYRSDYAEIPADHPTRQPGFWGEVDVAVCQTAANCRPPEFLAALRASAVVVRFPTLWLKILWPMYMVDPRNRAEPGAAWGRFPYGDRLALKLLREGVASSDLARRYRETDLNSILDLDRFQEMTFAELANNDRKSDVAIAPYLAANFRRRKLFGTVNHPNLAILHELYRGVLAALPGGLATGGLPEPECAGEVLGLLEEVPLHPQVIRHFQLAWARPEMRWRYRSEFLNLEDYLKAYADFRLIPAGEPPALFLARAQQAAALGDFPEARQLLLRAAIAFPQLSAFLQYLAILLLRRGELLEAEKVARHALATFPGELALNRLLGDIMSRAGHAEEAARCYAAASPAAPRGAALPPLPVPA